MLIKDLKTASDEDKKLCIVEITRRLTAAYYETRKWLVDSKQFSPDVADDAIQDAMISAITTLPHSLIQKPEAWLQTAAYHAALKAKRRQLPQLLEGDSQEAKPAADTVAQNETIKAIAEAIRSLPAESQEILLLVHFEGQDFEQAAEILEIHPGTARRRHEKAVIALRDRLRPFGGPAK